MATLIPHLVVHDGNAAVDYYKAALGAVENVRMPAQDGKRLMHASLTIDGAPLFLCDDFPEHCGGVHRAPKHTGTTGVTIHLNVPDCDAAIGKMVDAGGTLAMPAMDMFWGDRYGRVTDPFGHDWSFSTTLAPERAQAARAAFAKDGCA